MTKATLVAEDLYDKSHLGCRGVVQDHDKSPAGGQDGLCATAVEPGCVNEGVPHSRPPGAPLQHGEFSLCHALFGAPLQHGEFSLCHALFGVPLQLGEFSPVSYTHLTLPTSVAV